MSYARVILFVDRLNEIRPLRFGGYSPGPEAFASPNRTAWGTWGPIQLVALCAGQRRPGALVYFLCSLLHPTTPAFASLFTGVGRCAQTFGR